MKMKKIVGLVVATMLSFAASTGSASAAGSNVDLSGFKLVVSDPAGIFKAICEKYNCMAGAKYSTQFVTFATYQRVSQLWCRDRCTSQAPEWHPPCLRWPRRGR